MNQLKIDDFLLFSKVVEFGNFSRTAEQLGMVKSMISKRIGRLEDQLGVRLLHRSTRRMTLTEFGTTLYEYTTRIENEVTDAIEAMSASNDQPKGSLKVMVPHSFGNYFLSHIIACFVRTHPELSVDLDLRSTFPDLLESGYDVAIHVGEPPVSSHRAKLIGQHQFVVCASPDYLKKHGHPHSPEDLANHNCLIHKNLPEPSVWVFEQNKKQTRVKVKGNLSSNSSQSLKHAAIGGLGVVMLPDYTLKTELNDGRLIPMFSAYCPKSIGLYALFPYTKHVSPKLRVFLDFLAESL